MRHRSGTHPARATTPRRPVRLRPFAFVLAAALLAAAPAGAQGFDTEGLFRKQGLYLVAMGDYAIPTQKDELEDDADDALGPGASTDVDNSFGFDLRLGYRLHERFSVETQFDFLNAIELDSQLPSPGPEEKSEIKLFVLTGNAKYYLLTDRFQPYIVGGAGWGRSRLDPPGSGSKERDDGFAARAGLGFDFYGSEFVALTSEVSYVFTTGEVHDLDYVTFGAGLTLRFYMPRY